MECFSVCGWGVSEVKWEWTEEELPWTVPRFMGDVCCDLGACVGKVVRCSKSLC